MSFRAHAGDGEGFLEDGLAGEHGFNRHGYKSGGSGKGEFIILYNLFVSTERYAFSPFIGFVLHPKKNGSQF